MIQSHSSDNKRIAKNTLFLYLRSILVMVVSLYTSRVVLNTLGVNDYGIYNVVGGFVAMFSMMSATFASATQRFLSFEIGRNNKERLKDVFSVSLNIHFLLAFIIFILIEIFGTWFLNNRMNIPPDRLVAANWVLHCSMIAFAINLIIVPYDASIIANEKMNIFAYISMLEVGLKLLLVYLLQVIFFDKLIVYALLMIVLSLVISTIYGVYCTTQFKECKYGKVNDKSIYREILSISGWNFLGSSASIFTVEGIDVLLNLYGGGVAVNAAKGVASQVQNAVLRLITNFMTALNPQLTKSYAANDQDYMITLLDRGSRFSFYLMCMLSLPFILETNTILLIWLKTVPTYAVEFVRLILIYMMVYPFSTPLNTLILASGRIRNSQIVLAVLQFLNFPISYFLLKSGYPPYSIYFSFMLISLISLIARVVFTHNRTILSYSYYFKSVIFKSIIIIPISLVVPFYIKNFVTTGILRFFIVTGVIEIGLIISIYFIGLTISEKAFFRKKILLVYQNFKQ